MSTFSNLFAEIAIPALLEQLGEQVTYYAVDGGQAFTVDVTINRSVQLREASDSLELPDVLIVTCATDPNAAGGGVAEPQRGDAIWRSGNGDDESVRYAFTGEILSSNSAAWTAKFERVSQQQVGFTGMR